jgi:peptidoglycan hydrolase-like protein with peptidoglycan-binding domain
MRSFRFYRDPGLKKTVALLAALVVFGSPFASVAQPKPVPHPPIPRAAKPPASQDANIVKVQQALKEKGHDPGPVDGILGPNTRAALQAFQKSEGLDPSGRVDRGTLEKLGVQLTEFTPKQPVRKPPTPAQPK